MLLAVAVEGIDRANLSFGVDLAVEFGGSDKSRWANMNADLVHGLHVRVGEAFCQGCAGLRLKCIASAAAAQLTST
jgi:hypothetical protein